MTSSVAALPDVQEQPDQRGIALQEVGVEGLSFPITLAVPGGPTHQVSAEVDFVASLASDQRGTHMSRFVEVLAEHADGLGPTSLPAAVEELRQRLEAARARVQLSFDLYEERIAPVSGLSAPLRIRSGLAASCDASERESQARVRVPITSLCPCSKEISDYGAHSQRGYVEIVASSRASDALWPAELTGAVSAAASAPIYPLLKRSDERHVTMAAYDKPAFVEDVARDVYATLRSDERLTHFSVCVRNEESIHDHAAVARVSWSGRG